MPGSNRECFCILKEVCILFLNQRDLLTKKNAFLQDDLKATLTARNREAKQLTQLERTRQRNPSDRHVISQAETELQRATMDATRTTRHLEETIDNFEKQKIKDIKTIFSEFITIEMLFHGKALEVYTAAYQNIQKIDEEEDLEVGLCLSKLSSSIEIGRAHV